MGDNKQVDRMIHATQNKDRRIWKKFGGKNYNIGAIISLIIIALIWFFAAHAVNTPVYFPVSGRCTISDRILTYRYVRSGKPGNYDAPRYNRFGLCIRNRFPTWNDHGIFASAPAMDVPVYQFIETGSDHGLGTACHCMVWYRRRTYTFFDRIQRCLHDYPKYDRRCTGYQQRFLQCGKIHGCRHAQYHQRHCDPRLTSRRAYRP